MNLFKRLFRFENTAYRLFFDSLIYASSFIFIYFLDELIINRPIFSGPGDSVSSSFFLGVSALVGDFYDVHHQPAYLHNSIAAVILSLTGLPDNTLATYAYLTLSINLISVLAVGIVLGKLFRDVEFPLYALFLTGLVIASMPAVAGLLQGFSPYFLTTQLTAIGVFASYRLAIRRSNKYVSSFLIFFIFGLILADLFVIAGVLVGIFFSLTFSIPWSNLGSLHNKFGVSSKLSLLQILLIFGLSILFALSFRQFFGSSAAPAPLNSWPLHSRWFALGGLSLLVLFLLLIQPYVRQRFLIFLQVVYLPMLTGWSIATNGHYPGFGLSLALAIDRSGSIMPSGNFYSNVLDYLSHANWFYLYVLLFVIMLFPILRGLIEKEWTDSTKYSVYFIFSALIASIFFAIRRYPGAWPEGNLSYGGSPIIHTRYFSLSSPVIAFGFVWFISQRYINITGRFVVVFFVILISSASIIQYINHITPISKYTTSLNKLTNELLNRYPRSTLYCVDVSITENCQLLDGYNNNALLPIGTKRLGKTTALDGRVIWLDNFEIYCDPNKISINKCFDHLSEYSGQRLFLLFNYNDQKVIELLHNVIWINSDSRIALIELNRQQGDT